LGIAVVNWDRMPTVVGLRTRQDIAGCSRVDSTPSTIRNPHLQIVKALEDAIDETRELSRPLRDDVVRKMSCTGLALEGREIFRPILVNQFLGANVPGFDTPPPLIFVGDWRTRLPELAD
jgi:hypothetical protein